EDALVGNVRESLRDLIDAVKAVATKDRIEKIRQARFDETKKFTERLRAGREANAKKIWDNKPIEWDRVGKEIEAIADKDAIIVEEFGSQRNKCMDHINIGYGAKTQLGRTTGECLGWGLPAAIGVKLAKPNQQVWALQGDGGMLFNQTEALWPMRRHEAPIITVVVVADPKDLKPAMQRGGNATRDGKPSLLDVLVAQAGQGANMNWYPKVSIAEM